MLKQAKAVYKYKTRSKHLFRLTKYIKLNISLLNTCKWNLLIINLFFFNGQFRWLLVLWKPSPKERINGLSWADYIWLKGLLNLYIRYKTRFSSALLLNLWLMVTSNKQHMCNSMCKVTVIVSDSSPSPPFWHITYIYIYIYNIDEPPPAIRPVRLISMLLHVRHNIWLTALLSVMSEQNLRSCDNWNRPNWLSGGCEYASSFQMGKGVLHHFRQ